MNWVKKHKLPAIEALQYDRHSCIELNNLWQTLHLIFNLAQNHQIDLSLLDEILLKSIMEWLPFSKEEFKNAIHNCNNSSFLL